MGIADTEQGACHLDGQVKRGARRQIADIKVATNTPRRHHRMQSCRGGCIADGAGKRFQRHPALATEHRGGHRGGIVFPDMQCRLGKLIGQQPETRDIRRPAKTHAGMKLWRKGVDGDFQRVTRHRPFDKYRPRNRIDLAEIKRRHIGDGG